MQGLEFLHSHGVIVMDIKPDNIFCNCSSTFQIGDFGMAVVEQPQLGAPAACLSITCPKHEHAFHSVGCSACAELSQDPPLTGASSKSIGKLSDEVDVGVMQDWEEGDGDYLAPELLQEASPTPAADIYSLGATLYECATGVG